MNKLTLEQKLLVLNAMDSAYYSGSISKETYIKDVREFRSFFVPDAEKVTLAMRYGFHIWGTPLTHDQKAEAFNNATQTVVVEPLPATTYVVTFFSLSCAAFKITTNYISWELSAEKFASLRAAPVPTQVYFAQFWDEPKDCKKVLDAMNEDYHYGRLKCAPEFIKAVMSSVNCGHLLINVDGDAR